MSVPFSAIEKLQRMPLAVSDNFFKHKFVGLTYQKTDIPFFELKRKYNKTKVIECYREDTSELWISEYDYLKIDCLFSLLQWIPLQSKYNHFFIGSVG